MRNLLLKISVIVGMLMLTQVFPVAANIENDAKVEILNQKGIVSGRTATGPPDFDLDSEITRAEAAVLLTKSIYPAFTSETYTYSSDFSDIKLNDWFLPYVNYCKAVNILSGYPDGTFQANKRISTGELSIIMTRALHHIQQKPVDNLNTLSEYMQYAQNIGLFQGVENVSTAPEILATREIAFVMDYNLLKITKLITEADDKSSGDSLKNSTELNKQESTISTTIKDPQGFATDVINMVNQERAEQGVHALTADKILTEAAAIRVQDLSSSFSHIRPNNSSGFSLLPEKTFSFMGENIAKDVATPFEVFQIWKNSPSHYRNMINPCFTVIGVAYDADKKLWVQMFATYK